MGVEGLYLQKWQAVVFLKLQNNSHSAWRAITKFD